MNHVLAYAIIGVLMSAFGAFWVMVFVALYRAAFGRKARH